MKNILFSVLALFLSIMVCAQTPYDGIPYQTVLRNDLGDPLSDTTIQLTFQLRRGDANGQIIYSENQILLTNILGLASTEIGNGDASIGIFSEIDWSQVPIYLEVVMNGNSLGVSELNTVPYALLAKKAQSVNVQLSTNGDTLTVGDTLIAVSQFNSGLNGTGELLNDQSGMIQTTSLNVNCIINSGRLPYLRIKACDMDSLENIYYLIEYEGDHDFYGMQLNCSGSISYRLCKIAKNGSVIWWKPISLVDCRIRDAYLIATNSGNILLAANSYGNNGQSVVPFTVQLPDLTLSYNNPSKFIILFNANGNYLDHENIPGEYSIQYFRGNSAGFAVINENIASVNQPSILGYRMYQFEGSSINLMWINTDESWDNCLALRMDPLYAKISGIFKSNSQQYIAPNYYYNCSFKTIYNNQVTEDYNLFKLLASSESPIKCDFSSTDDMIKICFGSYDVGFYQAANPYSPLIRDFPLVSFSKIGNSFTILWETFSGSGNPQGEVFRSANSSLNNDYFLVLKNDFSSSAWEYYTAIAIAFAENEQINYVHDSFHKNNSFVNKIKGLYKKNQTLYIMGNYDCNYEEFGLIDAIFPMLPGKNQFPFVLKINLTQ